jgi:transcriptional regulator with XRE-family HTH domain
MLFRDELRRLREKAGLTQEGLAQKAGMSVGNVRNYEQGIRLPSFPGVVKLSKALGVDCTAFAECDDVKADENNGENNGNPQVKKTTKRGKK